MLYIYIYIYIFASDLAVGKMLRVRQLHVKIYITEMVCKDGMHYMVKTCDENVHQIYSYRSSHW